MKRCYFAGHSQISDACLDKKLEKSITKLVTEKGIKEFVVSNYGMFDKLSATVIRKLKSSFPEIRLVLVLPYLTKSINENREFLYDRFDEIMLADIPQNTPLKFRIIKMNEYMIKHSDFLICYVTHSFGGAFKSLEFAKRQNIEIINLNGI